MTFTVADRVQETTNSPGTGVATLLGAVSGYQSFSTGIGANNTTFYVIADQLGTNWEVGLGALNSTGTVLTRTTVYSSSNGGSTVNFATGTQYVWCDYPSSKAVIQGSAVNFSSIGATTAGTGAFTTLSYTGTLIGGTGIVNLGSGQFYIDGSGNVGIGTSSPSFKLDISGAVGNGIRYSDGTVGNIFGTSGGGGFVGTITNNFLAFYTNATERMRITSSGQLGINTTSPRSPLTVNGAISGQTFTVTTGALATNYFPFSMSANQTYMVFVSWNGNGGYALCLISGSLPNNAVVIASSNSSGGNNSFDTQNNAASNGANGVSMFYNAGLLVFQLKTNFTAAGSVYLNIFGM